MVDSISSNTYTYNGNEYRRRSENEAKVGFWVATIASAAIRATLPSFSNPFLKQMRKEHENNYLYRDAFIKALDISGLKDEGVEFVDTKFKSIAEEQMYLKYGKKTAEGEIKAGLNACYVPNGQIVKLNSDKAAISGFHEYGHALNHLKSKFGKILQKMRVPGYTIAGLMGTYALVARPKPKDAKRDPKDFVLDHCGEIAFAAMLPTVAEEALASYKGIKLAKKAGLADPQVKNLKKFYGKALLSYAGYALITGLSVFAASKITQAFTRPEKIE